MKFKYLNLECKIGIFLGTDWTDKLLKFSTLTEGSNFTLMEDCLKLQVKESLK